MADQGVSYRRGSVEHRLSRVQPTGIPSGAESYGALVLTGTNASPSFFSNQTLHLRSLITLETPHQNYSESLPETYSITDTVNLTQNSTISPADTLSTTDYVSTLQQSSENVTDNISTSDSVVAQINILNNFSDSVALSETLLAETVSTLQILETVTQSESLSVVSNTSSNVSDTLSVTDAATGSAQAVATVSDTITTSESLSLTSAKNVQIFDGTVILDTSTTTKGQTLNLTESFQLLDYLTTEGAVSALATSPTSAVVSFGDEVSLQNVGDINYYKLIPQPGGAPVHVLTSTPIQTVKDSGSFGDILITLPNLSSNTIKFPWVTIGLEVGDLLDISGVSYSYTNLRILAFDSLTKTVTVDRQVLGTDPSNGFMSWTLRSAIMGVHITFTESTQGASYNLEVGPFYQKTTGRPFYGTASFIAEGNSPTLISTEMLSDGSIYLSFSDPLLIEPSLLEKDGYRIGGPNSVTILGVLTPSENTIQLKTTGNFLPGANYTVYLPPLRDRTLNNLV